MPTPIPIPALGSTVVDAAGRSGIAQFDPNTGQPLSASPTTPSGSPVNSDFMDALQKQILGQSGMVSSYNTTLQNNIQSLQDAGTKSDAATNLSFDRQREDALNTGQNDLMNGRAAGSGGIMNLAALRELTNTTDKNLNDLESRRQEALLNNDAATAKSISDMQTKALEFQQKANQDVFSNLLNLGQYAIQRETEARATAAANDAHTKNLVEMIQNNPQAGILLSDTMEQAAAKIGLNPNSPEVQLKNAQIANIYSEIKNRGKTGTGTEADRKASAISEISSFLSPGAKFNEQQPNGSVISGKSVIDSNGYVVPTAWKQAIAQAPAKGLTREDFITQFGYLLAPIFDKSGATAAIDAKYGLTPQEAKKITG